MQVGDIIKKEHNDYNIKTKQTETTYTEEVITQERINERIIALYNEGKTIEEIATEFDRELTQEEVDLYSSKVAEQAQLEQERIANLPETKIAMLEEVIATLLLQGVDTNVS